MSRRVTLVTALAALWVAGCGSSLLEPAGCTDDSQCLEGQLCFPEGCASPDKGIVVEVTANTTWGHHAQDFPVTNLQVNHNIEVYPPMSLVGDVQQRVFSTQNSNATAPYTQQVTISAVGESELIPGVSRRYEASFATLEQGAYSMFIGAGKFNVTATAKDPSIPADGQAQIRVQPGSAGNQSFLFQSPETSVAVAALLVKSRGLPPIRDTVVPVKMEVQAVDPLTKRPLSQKAPVIKDDGSFTLWIDPAVDRLEAFEIVAKPADSTVVAPSKVFLVQRPLPTQLVLEMGSYGQSLPGISGTLRDGNGGTIANATVFLEGTVGGGGTYRTRAVTTDEHGGFKVEAFLSPPDSTFTLTAIPPPESGAGIFRGPVRVLSQNVEGYLSPNVFTCPDRVQVQGKVLLPDGTAAQRIKVAAEPIAAIDGKPLPLTALEVFTDEEGVFKLSLDPAEYRLDFLPGSEFPRRSRFATVRSTPNFDGGVPDVQLTSYTLWKGRKISGSVTSPQTRTLNSDTPIPYASVRFFHVTQVAGKPSSTLLAEGIADERGMYQVLLPAK